MFDTGCRTAIGLLAIYSMGSHTGGHNFYSAGSHTVFHRPWLTGSHTGISIHSLFAPGPIRSPERKFQYDPGQFAAWNFRSRALSFLGIFAPWNFRSRALSFPGTFVPGPFRSLELLLHGANWPWNFRSLEVLFSIVECDYDDDDD